MPGTARVKVLAAIGVLGGVLLGATILTLVWLSRGEPLERGGPAAFQSALDFKVEYLAAPGDWEPHLACQMPHYR